MEKIITCKKCRKTFKIFGSPSKAKGESFIVACPFCGESNDVMWPKDTVSRQFPSRRPPDEVFQKSDLTLRWQMSWKNQIPEDWLRIGFLAVFVVGIACAVLIIFSYYAKK